MKKTDQVKGGLTTWKKIGEEEDRRIVEEWLATEAGGELRGYVYLS